MHKEETYQDGTRFEFGTKALQRNSVKDWDAIRLSAQKGDLGAIPADVYIRCYNQLSRIQSDFAVAPAIERSCIVYWGPTGTGKSRTAWEQAGMEAYVKDPLTKWWCGYRGQPFVIIDEFRGIINISHLLRWLDRYPVRVETKGSSQPLLAVKFWITSNLEPSQWYPELDAKTLEALLRRLVIINLN